MIPVQRQLHLRDNGDEDIACRWVNDDGVPNPIASARAQVRQTDDSADVLIEGAVTLSGAPDHWVLVTFTAAAVEAADLEDATMPATWDLVVVRESDMKHVVMAAGSVFWQRGVTRG